MKFIEGLEQTFSIDKIQKERALWAQEENLSKEFEMQFAMFNSGLAISLFPTIIILGFITLIITEIFNKYNIHYVGQNTVICYVSLMFICAISYCLLYNVSKHGPENYKKINNTIYLITMVIFIWMMILIYNSSSVIGSVIIYTATISIVTQTMFLPPRFSGIYIFGGVLFFALVHIFDGKNDYFETDAILGLTIMSAMWFMISYMRYYSRCKGIYGEKIISAQNERLDEIIMQLKNEQEQLNKANAELETAYITDRLTGVHNRWHWETFSKQIAEKCVSEKKQIAIMMLDLDNFKSINDTYGHSVGDRCLVGISDVIKEAITATDNIDVFRMGGEEFAIISSELDKADALNLANIILKNITNIKIEGLDSMLTASIGVYISGISNSEEVEKHLIKADAEMYKAKASGKNRISFSFD